MFNMRQLGALETVVPTALSTAKNGFLGKCSARESLEVELQFPDCVHRQTPQATYT